MQLSRGNKLLRQCQVAGFTENRVPYFLTQYHNILGVTMGLSTLWVLPNIGGRQRFSDKKNLLDGGVEGQASRGPTQMIKKVDRTLKLPVMPSGDLNSIAQIPDVIQPSIPRPNTLFSWMKLK